MKKLIKAAADSGADMVKFQVFKPEDFCAPGDLTLSTGPWKGLDLYEVYRRLHALGVARRNL